MHGTRYRLITGRPSGSCLRCGRHMHVILVKLSMPVEDVFAQGRASVDVEEPTV